MRESDRHHPARPGVRRLGEHRFGSAAGTLPAGWRWSLRVHCADPAPMAAFWGAALGYDLVLDREWQAMLVPGEWPGPSLVFERAPDVHRDEHRVALDLEVPDVEAAAERLEALGATRVQAYPLTEVGTTAVLMADPEGNEFWLLDRAVR